MSENIYNSVEGTDVIREPKKKKSKKGLIVAAAVVVTVAVIASVVAGIFMSAPMTLVARGAANSAKAIQKTDLVKLLTEMSVGGSMELVLGIEELTEQAFGTALDGNIRFKVYGNGKDMSSAATVGLELDGESFVDLSVFSSAEDLIITSDMLLDDEAYGINLEDAADNFEDSVFGPYGELSIGVDNIDMYLDLLKKDQEMTRMMEELSAEVMEALLDSLKEHAEISKENDSLKFGKKSTKVTAVEIELDDDALKDVICDVLDCLRDSEKFEEFLDLYMDYFANGQKMSALVEYLQYQDYYRYYYDLYSFDDYYEYFYGDSEPDIDEIYDMLEDLEDELDYLEIDKLSLVCYITKTGTQLIGVDMKVKADGETVECSLMAGPSLDKLTELRFTVGADGETTELVYEVDTNDKSEYSATLSVETYGEELVSATIDWNKKNGDFELSVEEYGEELFEVGGQLTASDKSAVFTLEEISAYDETVELKLTVTLTASDKMPSAPADYEDVLEMSYEDVEELAMNAATSVMEEYYSLDEEVMEILDELLYGIF